MANSWAGRACPSGETQKLQGRSWEKAWEGGGFILKVIVIIPGAELGPSAETRPLV